MERIQEVIVMAVTQLTGFDFQNILERISGWCESRACGQFQKGRKNGSKQRVREDFAYTNVQRALNRSTSEAGHSGRVFLLL